MSNSLNRLFTGGIILAATLALSLPSHSQSFSVATSAVVDSSNYDYSFTLNYDQAGIVQSLTDPIYDWSFTMDPAASAPTQVILPIGWNYSFDPTSGQFDFYTQGPTGFGNSDFGPNVVQPGQSLSGFGLTTPNAPDLSIAFATDEQFNQDATTATLPTTMPAAVPEVSTWQSLGIMVVLGGMLAFRRTQCQTRNTNQ